MESNEAIPLIGIVVPVRNTGPFLEDCLASATSQTIRCDVVVVDDASEDPQTLDILKRWAGRVTVVTMAQRVGVSAARNAAIERLRTPYILPVDSDDIVDRAYAELASNVLRSDSSVSVVTGFHQHIGSSTAIDRNVGAPRGVRDLLYSNPVPAHSAFRRVDWQEVGGYASDLFWGEDWDFWLRILARGGKVHVIGQVLYYYRMHAGQVSNSLDADNKVKQELAIVERNRQIYSEHLATIMTDHWRMAALLGSFKHRYGRANDAINRIAPALTSISRRLRRK